MQIERLNDFDHDMVTYMAKGHVDLDVFAQEVDAQNGGDPLTEAAWSKPEHKWMRAVPRDGYGIFYIEAEPQSRGAFPATLLSSLY